MASRQAAAPDPSPPPFVLGRSVPANQRFNRRPATATQQLAFSATANDSDGEDSQPVSRTQTAKRPHSAASKATASKVVKSKRVVASQTERVAKKSGPPAVEEESEEDDKKPSDHESEAEEEEQQEKNLAKGKKQTAVKVQPSTPVKHRGATVAGKKKQDEPLVERKEQEQCSESRAKLQRGRREVTAQSKQNVTTRAVIKKPAAKVSDKQESGNRGAASRIKAAETDESSKMEQDQTVDDDRRTRDRAKKPVVKDKQPDDQSAVALLQAFSGSAVGTTLCVHNRPHPAQSALSAVTTVASLPLIHLSYVYCLCDEQRCLWRGRRRHSGPSKKG